MKGTFFQRPIEFRLQVDGESWHQGDVVQGRLQVKNHAAEKKLLENVRVELAHGELRKVERKAENAFSEIAKSSFDSSVSLDAGEERSFDWTFKLDPNCPITDVSGTPFLLYGIGAKSHELGGQLKLAVAPLRYVLEFLEIFPVTYHFLIKSKKNRKDAMEVKLVPPSSKTFASLEGLTLMIRMNGEALEVDYVFAVKEVDSKAGMAALKKGKKEFSTTFSPSEYKMSNGHVNHDVMQASIESVFKQLGLLSTIF